MTETMIQLEQAIRIALKAHAGQKDKAGLDYILHPLRVMMTMKSQEERITAVLHDVVEDSSWTFEALSAEGFSRNVLDALACLTRDPDNESYKQTMNKIKRNALALKVKLADLEDNMDVRRLSTMSDEDLARLKKYNRAWHTLNNQSHPTGE